MAQRLSSLHMLRDGVGPGATQGFISYLREDNEDFGGVVDEIWHSLSALFEAQTGQRIEFFLDRESIGWGEDWRARIELSVRNATVFVPIITLRYFNSQACLDELLAFEATARSLGVTDLILPIVLFGADQIRDEDERPEVRLIARLNYKSLEDAWRAGYDSSEWRRALSDCAKSLAVALRRSEDALASSEGRELENSGRSALPAPATLGDDEIDETFDLEAMTAQMGKVTAKLEEATTIFEELSAAASVLENQEEVKQLSRPELSARLLMAARNMSDPALRLEKAGSETEAAMLEVDPQLREFVRQMARLSIPDAQVQLRELIESVTSGNAELAEVEAGIAEFIEMARFISLMNVSIRKSLRPAIRGLRSLESALRIFTGWRELASRPQE